jgi:hypothetical protein
MSCQSSIVDNRIQERPAGPVGPEAPRKLVLAAPPDSSPVEVEVA